jgi:hypothetical protein
VQEIAEQPPSRRGGVGDRQDAALKRVSVEIPGRRSWGEAAALNRGLRLQGLSADQAEG